MSTLILTIYSARDGKKHQLELMDDSQSIHQIRQHLQKATSINADNQIILYGPPYIRLDPRKPLYAYALPSNEKEIYLYDRSDLGPQKMIASPVQLQPMHLELPKSPTSTSNSSKLLSESSSPLLRALADYEQQFLLQFDQARVLERGGKDRLHSCGTCIEEMTIQENAVKAAISNLESFQISISRRFNAYWKEFQQQTTQHEKLLAGFETDILQLRKIQIHPVLQGSGRQTLLECIPYEREKAWARECESSLLNLSTKSQEIATMHDSICNGVGKALVVELFLNKRTLQLKLKELETSSELASEYTLRLEKNYNKVVDRVAETSRQIQGTDTSMFGSSNALEACRGLDELWRDQAEFIPAMINEDQKLQSFMETLGESKTDISTHVHAQLRSVSTMQSEIRDLGNTLGVLKDALSTQCEQFTELQHLHLLPESYRACLSEIVRRRQYGALFSQKMECMAEEIANMREKELEIRNQFLSQYGQHLPRDFVPGLAEKPSHCEFRVRPFDLHLPVIDDVDLLIQPKSTETTSTSSMRGSLLMPANPDYKSGNEELQQEKQKCKALVAQVDSLRGQLSRQQSSLLDTPPAVVHLDSSVTTPGATCGFPILMALAAAADMAGSEEVGSSLNSHSLSSQYLDQSSGQLQDECSRALAQNDEYAIKIQALEQQLENARIETLSRDDKNDDIEVVEREGIAEMQDTMNILKEDLSKKDTLIEKIRTEKQQYLINAADLEQDLQEFKTREKRLEEKVHALTDTTGRFYSAMTSQSDGWKQLIELVGSDTEESHGLTLPPVDIDDFINWSSKESLTIVVSSIQKKLKSGDTSICLAELQNQLKDCEDQCFQFESEIQSLQNSKIAFLSFTVDDVALFLPTTGPDADSRVYLAFHLGCPHRYLSEETISSFRLSDNTYPDYILGKIVYIDQHVSCDGNNPFNLQYGTTFYMLMVASLSDV